MAVYYKVKCPHCGGETESGKDRQVQYGSPLRKCRNCGKEYVDDNYVEAATQNIETVYKKEFSWGSLVYITIGILFLFLGIKVVHAFPIVFGVGALILGVASFVSNIKYKPKEDPVLQQEILASQRRLENPHYVLALNKANIYVPAEKLAWAKKKVSEESLPKETKTVSKETIVPMTETKLEDGKERFSTEELGGALAEICIKELVDIMGICSQYNVAYNEKKLIISTFAYFFVTWIFNMPDIISGHVDEAEEVYKEKFGLFNRKQFENIPYKDVLENEKLLADKLCSIERRVRNSYQANSHTFVDDGISDEFILEFIDEIDAREIIKNEIVQKMLGEWAVKAQLMSDKVIIYGKR